MSDSGDWKAGLLDEFRLWLETLEEPPEGESQEAGIPDLASFFGEMSALREEVRLQSRSVRSHSEEMLGRLDELGQSLSGDSERMSAVVEQLRGEVLRSRQAGEESVLKELVGLRESLAENVRLLEGRSLSRLFVSRSDRCGLRESQENECLLLKKADDILRRYGIEPLVRVGMPFDASVMRVISTVESASVAPGCVAVIYAQGYRRNGVLMQTAEVAVRSGR